MELQPIVGSACATCSARILVDTDGKNCKRCGLAVHRRCSKAHRERCANRPMVTSTANDYGEVAPLAWTPRLVAILAIGTFSLSLGLRIVTDPGPDHAPGDVAAVASPSRWNTLGWAATAMGVAAIVGGYFFERSRQDARPR